MLERGSRRGAALMTAVLFVVWANLHGGFVYGWVLIAVYLGGSLGELFWGTERALWRERVRTYGTMLISSAVATFLNPHGLELHRHLFGFFGTPFLRDNTSEFASPSFHEPAGKAFLVVLLLCLLFLPCTAARRCRAFPDLCGDRFRAHRCPEHSTLWAYGSSAPRTPFRRAVAPITRSARGARPIRDHSPQYCHTPLVVPVMLLMGSLALGGVG